MSSQHCLPLDTYVVFAPFKDARRMAGRGGGEGEAGEREGGGWREGGRERVKLMERE